MTENFGKVTRPADGFQVRFERTLPYPIQKVWEAITQPEKLKIWFTDMELDFVPGGKITIYFRDKDRTVSYGEIVRIEPPHRFEFTWEHELAVWELFEEGESSCRLILTYSRLTDPFAASAPAGLHMLLDQLETMLAGRTDPYPFGDGIETPESRKLQGKYAGVVFHDFPDVIPATSEPVVLERTFQAPVEKVWQAISDREKMKHWYFDLAAFKPEVGFRFQFNGGTPEKEYLHLCTVTEVIPGKKLSYSWRYDGHAGNSVVSFELFPEGAQTRLKLSHAGLESFPALPDFAKANFVQGWTDIIGESLKRFVEREGD